MRYNGFDSEPDNEVIERLENGNGRRVCLVDFDNLRLYLRRRLREERVSLYRLANGMEYTRTALSTALSGQHRGSLELYERILYIVDGGADKYRWYLEQEA